jgi:hypothetical protein
MGLRRTPVKIELDGKERELRFDLNALCLFEETAKLPLAEALAIRSMSVIRALIWAGLLHEDSLLTVEDVGRMEIVSLPEMINRVMQALGSGQPSAARPTRAATVTVAASTGASSGVSDGMTTDLAIQSSGD